MELRTLTLIAYTLLASAAHAHVRAYPLDERIVYTVRISRDAPTTCVFPGALTALEGADISTKPDETAALLLSYQSGADFFSIRALRETGNGALNVVFRGKVYALSLVSDSVPDRVVRFLEESPTSGAAGAKSSSADAFAGLVAHAKHSEKLLAEGSTLSSAITRTEPGTITVYPMFTVVVAQVFRFEAEDALVFRLRFVNEGDVSATYDAARLAIRCGATIYPVVWSDGSGAVPPRGHTEVFAVIAGAPGGGRANLRVTDRFSVLAPRP